jgi:hypothetical protein
MPHLMPNVGSSTSKRGSASCAEIESLEACLTALKGSVARSPLTVSMEPYRVLGPLGIVAVGIGKVAGKLFVWR